MGRARRGDERGGRGLSHEALATLAARGVDLGGMRRMPRPGLRTWLLYEKAGRQRDRSASGIPPTPRSRRRPRMFRRTPGHRACLLGADAVRDPGRLYASLAWLRADARGGSGATSCRSIRTSPFHDDNSTAWREALLYVDAAVRERVTTCAAVSESDRAAGGARRFAGRGSTLGALKRAARGGVLLRPPRRRLRTMDAGRGRDVVDCTGAGDAFAGGFLSGLIEHGRVDEALARRDLGELRDRGVGRGGPARGDARARRRAPRTLVRRAPTRERLVNHRFLISEEVAHALAARRPVVALETTVVTHGLPHPQGLEAAAEIEREVARNGAVPATIGVLEGRIHLGMSPADLERLVSPATRKLNLGNLAAQVAAGEPGSTTVAATMFAAAHVGIRVFATGGIGGVHRGASESGDVSADLIALTRYPVAVVCAGAKAVLDLSRTVEMLETLGVPVYGVGTDDFPAFYRRSSGRSVDRRFDDAAGWKAMQHFPGQAALRMRSSLITRRAAIFLAT